MLTVTSASADVTSAAWVDLGETFADPKESQSYGGEQAALIQCRFSDSGATATIALAAVDDAGEVWWYREGLDAAGARRTDADNGGGDYVGMGPDFKAGAAPTAYVVGSNVVDVAHPKTSGSQFAGAVTSNSTKLKWKIGVVALSAGTVNVSWVLVRQI